LSGILSEKEIKSGLKIRDRDEALASLVDAAYSAGAPDNVTVILADIDRENGGMPSTSLPATFPITFLGAALDEETER
jgi:serine/threonine protein phosphatase PrpC